MMRIGFRYVDSRAWQGGYNYLLNLCSALSSFTNHCEPVVFVGRQDLPAADVQRFEQLLGENLILVPGFTRESSRKRLISTLARGSDRTAYQVFSNAGIDVVFENADFFGRRFGIPLLSWFPDFQHRHLPFMFTRPQWWKREIGFRLQGWGQRTLMVSSEDAKKDLLNFYRVRENDVHVVPFAVPFDGIPSESERANVLKKYEIESSFVIVCNQFWKHKNHALIAEALQVLSEQGREAMVVATGGASNPMNWEVYKELKSRIDSLGVSDRYRLLGSVPYSDLVCLRAEAAAVLNPSRFEGWNTAVEEAKSANKTTILSDIPIHREQADEFALFFSSGHAGELADCLSRVLTGPRSARPEFNDLGAKASQRLAKFAKRFETAVEAAHVA